MLFARFVLKTLLQVAAARLSQSNQEQEHNHVLQSIKEMTSRINSRALKMHFKFE